MRGRKDEAAAHHVEAISGPVVFVENNVERGSLAGRGRGRIAPVAEGMRRSMGKQQNVTGGQLARRAALRVLQHGRPAEDHMIGDLAELAGRKVNAPGRTQEASVIEGALDRDHLQKTAQPIAGVFHLDLLYEMNGHLVEIIWDEEYQVQVIHSARGGSARHRRRGRLRDLRRQYGQMVPDRRGLAVGLTAAEFGAEAALTVIPIRAVIDAYCYAAAFFWFRLTQGGIIFVLAWLMRAPRPGEAPSARAVKVVHATESYTP